MKKVWSIFAIFIVVLMSSPVWAFAPQREDVKRILKRLEEDTDRYSKSLDSALDKSALNGTRAEDEINNYVHQFEEATDHLKDRYEDQGCSTEFGSGGVESRSVDRSFHAAKQSRWQG
jgi:hypothetical protein